MRKKNKPSVSDVLKGNFMMTFPYKENSIDQISYRILGDTLILYFYKGSKAIQFKREDIIFEQLSNPDDEDSTSKIKAK